MNGSNVGSLRQRIYEPKADFVNGRKFSIGLYFHCEHLAPALPIKSE